MSAFDPEWKGLCFVFFFPPGEGAGPRLVKGRVVDRSLAASGVACS